MIESFLFKFLKWSPNFSLSFEPTLFPAWITIHRLQIHFFDSKMLRNIDQTLGQLTLRLRYHEPFLS
ncbi:hypothetical protein KSP40_PGU003085 [Platanthera guangdongensis]|uniref:DUF4283 domain-containing protein n=1 Tax=Platanthera guangdongensis TaxID=2320717 RepID=A0ABR2MUH9_9ASPA